MNRLINYFENKAPSSSTLNIYFTAGYPLLDDTTEIIKHLENYGTDIIELGIPFSDPLADGPTIQNSSEIALQNGMSIDKLFDQLVNLREYAEIPVVLMGYLNPIIQYGIPKFIKKAAEVGIDGFILPDLPIVEFQREWADLLEEHRLTFTFLVTPETSPERIKKLDALSSGFLYAVASSSTTGSSKTETNTTETSSYLNDLKSLNLKNPVLAGFGISNDKMFEQVNDLCDGAIIGSAFIKHLTKNGANKDAVSQFISSIKSV
jgi:tryptophan synthase alpha chain